MEDGDYDGFASLLPELPDHLLAVCRRLRAKSHSPEYRAQRAWEAGYWAGLVKKGRVPVPRASKPLSLSSTVYVVLAAPGVRDPVRVGSAAELHRVLGRVTSKCVYHGFPSLAEAEVYCAAAGIGLPSPAPKK